MNDMVLGAEHQALFHEGQAMGIGGGTVLDLIKRFGLPVARFLLSFLTSQPAGQAVSLQTVLVGLLKDRRPEILHFLSDTENDLLDKIIGKLSV